MFILWLTRLVAGYVRFSVSGGFPERFFNLCAREGIAVWDMAGRFGNYSAYTYAADYRKIRSCVRRSGVKARLCEKHGLPFLLIRYRFRWGMAVGATLFFAVLILLSSFVWSVDITGLEQTDPARIASALKRHGIYEGALIRSIDGNNVRQELLLQLEELSWMSINITGAKATVEVKERNEVPLRADQSAPCNIKAAVDGRIIRMNVFQGETTVQIGDAVVAGDLLVSGVLEYTNGSTAVKHAAAEVFAETQRKLTVDIPFAQTATIFTGRTIKKYALTFFHLKLPLFLGSIQGDYEKTVGSHQLKFGGTALPASLLWAEFRQQQTIAYTANEEQAVELACVKLAEREQKELANAAILSRQQSVLPIQGGIRVSIDYFCVENISIEEEILIFE